jgi:hypothetical protein
MQGNTSIDEITWNETSLREKQQIEKSPTPYNKRRTIPIQGDGVAQEELQTKTKKKRINYKKQEQYQYKVMEWLKKNYKPKPKKKELTTRNKNLNAIFLMQNFSMQTQWEKNEEGEPIALRLFIFGMQTTITKTNREP